MTPEVLVPQSAAVQALAFGIAIGAVLAGGLCWAWGGARNWEAGYRKAYSEAWPKGWTAGVADVVQGLTTGTAPDDTAGRITAGMRRHRGAVAAWRNELRGNQ